MKGGRQQSGELTLLRFMLLLLVARQGLSKMTSAGSDQAQALLDFKKANGNNSRTLKSWVTGTDFCSKWKGVTCHSNSLVSSVQAVHLPHAGLVGELSRSLGKLTSLGRLELIGNSITGPVPVQLSALRRLKHLKLDSNLLGGSFPQWLGNMSKLREVSMANNQIRGEIPSGVFTKMSSLKTLVFSNNSLTGPIPSDLDLRLNSSLEIVLLSENRLTGSIPHSIASSQSLQIVDISNNSFTGELPEVWDTPSLASLDCSSNNLAGTIPKSLFMVPNLHYLNLADNSFTGEVTHDISCRFGESAFKGNEQLIVEPCTRGSSPVSAPILGDPNSMTSPSPSPLLSSAHVRRRVPIVITVLSSLVIAGAIVSAMFAKACLPFYYALRRRQHNVEFDLKMKVENNLSQKEQFLQVNPGSDRMQAFDARADGTLNGGSFTKDKSSGVKRSSSRQSEHATMKETFNDKFIMTPIAHSSELAAGRRGGRRWFLDRSGASSTEFSDIDEYVARCYTANMYTDLLDKVMGLRENSLRREQSLRRQHTHQRSSSSHGDLEQANSEKDSCFQDAKSGSRKGQA